SGWEQPVCDVQSLLLVEALLERHPDRVVVHRGLTEQGQLDRRLLGVSADADEQEAAGGERRAECLARVTHELPLRFRSSIGTTCSAPARGRRTAGTADRPRSRAGRW